MKPKKSTLTDLVVELTALNPDGELNDIIAEAQAGEYHDYKNTKYICGKVELVNKLAAHERCKFIRAAVINGDYDESPDEEDKALMRKDIMENMPETSAKQMLKSLGLE
jgi:hypothetical protein